MTFLGKPYDSLTVLVGRCLESLGRMSLPPSVRPGDVIDGYRLEALVATGGMASIFRATDTKTGCRVALKIPRRDPLAIDRLRLETEIGRELDHPGLVKVLPADGARDRYVVMEWVDGRLLRQIMDEEGPLSSGRCIRIALAICNALEYIHSRGVVHGDLKPDNVIVDVADNIKLIDFGISRETKVSLWRRPKLEGAAGTPDYVSPEQIRGKRTDARGDVYSLGIVLFEMLAGEVPFSGLDPAIAMNLRVLAEPPSVGEINPGISPRLQAVVHRAIARDRGKRYANAGAIASDLLAEESEAHKLQSLASV
jgi:eukaryotic-like serine/threonine-protein kinase